jgi:MerR family transcriptional regulator, thiopeptide resistance regulator
MSLISRSPKRSLDHALGDLYVSDERFTAHYDQVRPGLAQFFRDGMHAFADRASADR